MHLVWLPVDAPGHGGVVDAYASATGHQLAQAILTSGGFTCAAEDLTLFVAKHDNKWLVCEDTATLKSQVEERLTHENLLWPHEGIHTKMADAPRSGAVHVLVVVTPPQKKKRLHELLPEGTTPSLFAGLKYSDSWTRVLQKHSGQIDCHRRVSLANNDQGLGEEGVCESDELPVAPIGLLHEVFARFQDDLQHIAIGNADCEFVVQICKTVATPQSDKGKYVDNVRRILGDYLHLDLRRVFVDDAPCDDVFDVPRLSGLPWFNVIIRPQRGDGTGDTTMENIAHYLKQLPTDLMCQVPCLLVDICGPMLTIFGIVNVSDRRAVCEPLAPLIPLLFFDSESLLTTAARAFAALKVAVRELEDWTERDCPKRESTAFHPGYALFCGIPPRPWFPYKDTVKAKDTYTDAEVTLQYKRVITSTVYEAWHPLLKADVVVKVVRRRYGSAVHDFCHTHQFAPRLYNEEVLPGGWIFVVMERVADLQSLGQVEDQQTVRDQLRELEELLKQGGFVHGDLRRENVLWDTTKQHVVVLDFDWAGKEGVAAYPMFLVSDANWPEGVDCGRPIQAAHDAELLRRLLV